MQELLLSLHNLVLHVICKAVINNLNSIIYISTYYILNYFFYVISPVYIVYLVYCFCTIVYSYLCLVLCCENHLVSISESYLSCFSNCLMINQSNVLKKIYIQFQYFPYIVYKQI